MFKIPLPIYIFITKYYSSDLLSYISRDNKNVLYHVIIVSINTKLDEYKKNICT